MTDRTVSSNGSAHARAAAKPSVGAFAFRHRGVSFGVLALIVVLLAVVVPAILGSGSGQVSDSSPCSAWSSASRSQRAEYGRLYVREYGALPSGARSPESVESAVNAGCTAAAAYADADTVNVIQAIDGHY